MGDVNWNVNLWIEKLQHNNTTTAMENSTENKIYISTLKTAIQKALTKNLPLILNDVVEYLEKHDFEVKQRKRRTKTKSLHKKTQACLNLNTKPLQISEFSDDGKEKIKTCS